MAGGRKSAGERVLEGKHVIGLFLLMLVFSGLFFTLGYVMGRNQYDGQVRAATTNSRSPEPAYVPKDQPAPKNTEAASPAETESDAATDNEKSGWEFYNNSKPAKSEPRLDPASQPAATPAVVSKTASARPAAKVVAVPVASTRTATQSSATPIIPNNSIVLQVMALKNQDDALTVASSLQKKHFAAYVQAPQKDKLYRVQVGPFKDQKSAEAARKGLESAGFKAFIVKH